MDTLRHKIYQALRGSESFFKTDMVYIFKGGFWLSFGQVGTTLAGFLLSIAFANLFPKESFGTYKFILSMVGIIGAFSLTGLNISIIQSVARGFGGSLRQGFWLNLRWSIGIFLGGLALAIYYFINSNLVLSFSFLLAGILSPLIASANLYGPYLLGKKDFKRNSLFSTIRNIVPSAALILTLFLTSNLVLIISIYFLVGLMVSLFIYYATTLSYQNDNKIEDPELVSYSGHLSAMDILGKITSYLDKILVFHYLGAAPLAIYAFAIAPVEQLQSGKKILSTLILPKVSGKSFEELQATTPGKTILLIIYALGLAGLWILIAPYFYTTFFPQYSDSIFYSQIYSFTLLAVSGTLFNETLVAHQKTRELYFHRTVMPALQLILFFIMLPIYGLTGLIITHIIIRSLSGLLGYYLVTHPFKNTST